MPFGSTKCAVMPSDFPGSFDAVPEIFPVGSKLAEVVYQDQVVKTTTRLLTQRWENHHDGNTLPLQNTDSVE